ncbi:54S ribosomal protein L3 mitochondrial [Purpureocillium takamizusanense]|uniref:Large ribosomal subunit protein mL44 n=1 Tax=Purpureocillium takamizusanense TaxID=2060973 RepID=A0A9Q8QP91_9HYPO|nr:54S ribosomal protein L3 mitochondrial [Purpureocillium takamizusanense]UNI22042.1 54S ribosomal protein L3 mitochondrial [Purpureocillium takamizusanense]
MKRLRAARWSGQLLQARAGACPAAASRRQPFFIHALRCQSSSAAAASEHHAPTLEAEEEARIPLPSPPHHRAADSAKLAAMHARLSLSKKIPLETLARCLVTPSADSSPGFNNSSLAFLGSTLVNYHVLEYLVCKWPRLPMAILYEALRAYAGPESLQQVARRWGVEAAAAPGEEVDPGLLQWTPHHAATDQPTLHARWGYVRSEAQRNAEYRRGISSRVVLDDDFGDALAKPVKEGEGAAEGSEHLQDEAFASFVRSVVGSIYAHCGREAAKAFVTSHILSRQIDPSVLFEFKLPTRELAMLCAREGFEAPLARLESETGRLSRTPVYVVGIYSGKEKLGEGAGPSLDIARRKASMNALKAWYLYSPGNKVRVPSDTMEEGAQPWKAPHIDIGEII